MRLVFNLSSDIGMTLVVSKCLTVTVNIEKIVGYIPLRLDGGTIITSMSTDLYETKFIYTLKGN